MLNRRTDFLLLTYLDPAHESLRGAPPRYVADRLGFLIRAGLIAIQHVLGEGAGSDAERVEIYQRTVSGEVRLAELENSRSEWDLGSGR